MNEHTLFFEKLSFHMIINFKHKGLKYLYESGSTRGINAAHKEKLEMILSQLDAALTPNDLNLSGLHLHPLKGDLKDHWSVFVNGNWRVTFRFIGNDVELVDYQDYH